MQERQFITKIHKKLPISIYKWKINDSYHGGVPDCFYSGPAGHCFVEYKFKKELPKIIVTGSAKRNPDVIAKYLGIEQGDIVKIVGTSETSGIYINYRVAV